MARPLRLAITADPELPVPPRLYGGIERIVHLLVEGLVDRGHDVTLFAHADSTVRARLVPYGAVSSRGGVNTLRNLALVGTSVRSAPFDLVHSFGRLAYLAPLAGTRVPKLMSYQRHVTPASIRRARRLFGGTIEFAACSRHMIEPVARLAPWHVVPNGVPIDRYTFRPSVATDAPLVFLGRIEAIKGPQVAIDVARRAGRRLVIAGTVAEEHRQFFATEIQPFVDGHAVEYRGPVDDGAKNALLGEASALLMPILWDEPFGIVMAEALACGTPVVGFDRAAVPEVVSHGVTGWVATDVDGLVEAIRRVPEIDRGACRRDAEARFSDRAVVDGYEAVYARLAG